MKIIYCILLTLILLANVKGEVPVTIEQFKKMTWDEQLKAYEQASSEDKPEMKKILLHGYLLFKFGGEDGLKMKKENKSIEARGLIYLDLFYGTQLTLWECYITSTYTANEKAGMAKTKQKELYDHLEGMYDPIEKRYPVIHQLIFKLAPSPEALALAKKAEMLDKQIDKVYNFNQPTPIKPITKGQLAEVDKQADQIYEELKKLPSLTPEQIQKEYDAIPDDKVLGNSMW